MGPAAPVHHGARAFGPRAASLAGAALAAVTAGVAGLRRTRKPLHPRGVVTHGVLRREGASTKTGVPWLDEPGVDDVLVRRSRAVGLPSSVPDIHGLAMRMPTATGSFDLLLASTGLGRLTRFLLTSSRSPWARPLTTLLPYRSPRGPVLLAAEHSSETQLELWVASPWGPWSRFARLKLSPEIDMRAEAAVNFDPIANTTPGLENYDWVRRLRQPAYRTARRSRRT